MDCVSMTGVASNCGSAFDSISGLESYESRAAAGVRNFIQALHDSRDSARTVPRHTTSNGMTA
ncbi:hypothetical protein MILUP08_45508 [Micromonospora lupini str. Lupac 08]|uniref:Uncharacterized protein n=1 Tax=Micromonospora lupini str. Lupac 08 TaxID=1150864 RepID=I0L9X7_9ACTN|nr:hypothetical protein MILUP08_45508 [Micromonospora lupini str. Lupac 08]